MVLYFIAFPVQGWYLVPVPLTVEVNSVITLFPMSLGTFPWENDQYECETNNRLTKKSFSEFYTHTPTGQRDTMTDSRGERDESELAGETTACPAPCSRVISLHASGTNVPHMPGRNRPHWLFCQC